MKTIKAKHEDDIPDNFTGIIEWGNGDKYWLRDRFLHRADGPAVERVNGCNEYFVDGRRHRTDGPAYEGYCIDGKKTTKKGMELFNWLFKSETE